MSKRILIVGCGYVGAPLATRLHREGHEVWGLKRNIDTLPHSIKPIQADLTDPASWPEFPADLDAVVFSAAANSKAVDVYRLVFVEGMKALLKRLAHQDKKPRVLMTSSTGVFGQERGEWIDESDETIPPNESNEFILEGEQVLTKSDFESVVVRFAGIYGPGRIRLIRSVLEGKAVYGSGIPSWLNHLHREDCVGVLAHFLEHPNPEPVYIAADNEPTTRKDILEWVARRLSATPPRMVPTEPSRDGKKRGNKRCRNQRLLDSGYEFVYPTYREGYQALIDDV